MKKLLQTHYPPSQHANLWNTSFNVLRKVPLAGSSRSFFRFTLHRHHLEVLTSRNRLRIAVQSSSLTTHASCPSPLRQQPLRPRAAAQTSIESPHRRPAVAEPADRAATASCPDHSAAPAQRGATTERSPSRPLPESAAIPPKPRCCAVGPSPSPTADPAGARTAASSGFVDSESAPSQQVASPPPRTRDPQQQPHPGTATAPIDPGSVCSQSTAHFPPTASSSAPRLSSPQRGPLYLVFATFVGSTDSPALVCCKPDPTTILSLPKTSLRGSQLFWLFDRHSINSRYANY